MGYSKDLQLLLNSNNFNGLKSFYANQSILDIVGVSRLERVHSNFLYWLLSPNETHDLNEMPIRNFLFACLGQKYRMIGNYNLIEDVNYIFPDDWADILMTNSMKYSINDYKIYKEYYIKDVGRVDLLISLKLCIDDEFKNCVKDKTLDLLFVIENKIESSENDAQTERYVQYFENGDKDFKDKQKVYMYLVPDSKINKPANSSFLPFQYQDLINMLITKCLDKKIPLPTKCILETYLRGLTFSKNSENTIIAITDKEVNLVNRLWEDNPQGLREVIYKADAASEIAYKTNKETFDNIFYISTRYKDWFNNIETEDLIKMKELSRKTSPLYEYNGETYKRNGGKNSLSRLALAIIKEYITKQNSNVDTLLNDFDKICATYHKIPLIIEKKEIKKPEYVDEENGKSLYFVEEDDIIKINNKEYVLYAYWDNSEIQRLIEQTKNTVKVKEIL